jgi:hypothetical protein
VGVCIASPSIKVRRKTPEERKEKRWWERIRDVILKYHSQKLVSDFCSRCPTVIFHLSATGFLCPKSFSTKLSKIEVSFYDYSRETFRNLPEKK